MNRSLNGLQGSTRSLNGLEGEGIEKILSGDAINVVETSINNKTINLDISKQTAVGGTFSDTDLFVLETSSGEIKKITGSNMKSGSFSSNWDRAGGFIKPVITTDKLQLFSSITNDSTAQTSFADILTFKNTTNNLALATFKYQINDTSSNSTSNAKFKMVHYDSDTNITTDIYSIDTSSILTFSKRLTLTNGLKQGSFDYTMPSASGTLALQSELDDIWSRSSTNITQTNVGDTITLNYQADATYKDTLLIKNTNAGTDILTYKFQIKDNGNYDAKLNFKVDYDRGGGTSIDIFDISYDGFLQVKKRLDIANGFFANSGEEYDFPSTGGTMVLEALTQTLSNKTFADPALFNQSLYVKYDASSTVSGFIRFFEATGQGNNGIDLHVENHSLASSINVFLPNSVNNTVLVGRNTSDTLENKTLKLPRILDITGDDSYIFGVSALANDRTITLPSLTGNDTFVFKSHTETLSNKTFDTLTEFKESLIVKQSATSGGTGNNAGFIKMYDADSSNYVNFQAPATLVSDFDIYLPAPTTTETLVGNLTPATLSNKTITSFTGNSSASITTPSTSGTLALQSELDDLWNESGPPSARVLATSNSNVLFLTIDNNCCIANKINTNQQIKFTHPSGTTDKISLLTTNVEVKGKIVYEANNNYYLLISNGIIQHTMETFKIPQDMYLQNASNASQYIRFENDLLKVEYSQMNVKNGFQIKNSDYTSTTSLGFLDEELIIDFETVSLRGYPRFGSFEQVNEDTGDWLKFTSGNTRFNSYKVEMCNSSSSIEGDCMIAFERSGDYLYINCPATTATTGSLDQLGIISYHKNGSVIFFNTSSDYLSGSTNYFSFGYRDDQEARITMNGVAQISDEWVDNSDPSDKRIKYDIKDYGNATEVINKIKIKSFMKYRVKNFNNDKDGNMLPFKQRLGEARYSIGVIAQELYEIPELRFMVRQNDFNDITPAYIHDWKPIIALLVKSNQEQQEEKNKMKKEIDTLKNEVEILKDFMNELITAKSFAEFKKKIS